MPDAIPAALELDGCRAAAGRYLQFQGNAGSIPDLLQALDRPTLEGREELMAALANILIKSRADERAPWLQESWTPSPLGLVTSAWPSDEWRRRGSRPSEPKQPRPCPLLRGPWKIPTRSSAGASARALATMGLAAREAGPALLRALAREEPRPSSGQGWDPRPELQRAVVATRAGKDDARLRVEDEIRAAIVAHVVSEHIQGDRAAGFILEVLGETAPKGLLEALARRGVSVPAGPTRLVIAEVVKTARDLALVETTLVRDLDSSETTYVVGLDQGRWTVMGSRGRGIP
jgi:hypothetical protein